jgi:hypothetical protein
MDYDLEREKRKSEEVRKVFREMFPLTNENDLPWAVCQIPEFLKKRIDQEVADGVCWFQQRVCRVLCEVSPPKTHVEDMARIVVEKAKELERAKESLRDLKAITKERNEMLDLFRQIGKLTGCDHTEDADGRAKLVQCIDDQLTPRGVVEDLVDAGKDLLALIDSVPVDQKLGNETDRVFPRYEFESLRAAVANARPYG